MWLEINEPFKDKCLVNIPYNPSKNLTNLFLNDLSAEVSNAYSLTDNILVFGDYNIDQFNKKRKNYLITLHLVWHLSQQMQTFQLAYRSLLHDAKSNSRVESLLATHWG